MTIVSIKRSRIRQASTLAALTASAALVLSACSSDDGSAATSNSDSAAASSSDAAPVSINEPVAVSYDGGVALLDGQTLQVIRKVPTEGFTRVNPAGDDDHVIVSTKAGFTVLDATHAKLTDVTFPGSKPGHVVRHGKTVLFTDSTGTAVSFDPHELADGKPRTRKYTSEHPHHGIAIELADGTLLSSMGDEETRPGAHAVDANGKEIARSEECPGIHGEAVASGDVVGFGCKDGVLLFKNGAFVKVAGSNPAYAATSTQAGSSASPVLLGNYFVNKDAESEAPSQFALVDTVSQKQTVVPMPQGVTYSFRSLGRGPNGEGLILGTDGKLHVIDPATGRFVKSVDVIGAWQLPEDWQAPQPAMFVRGGQVYVTDPASKSIKRVNIESGEVSPVSTLDFTPNEVSGTVHEH